MLEEFDGLTPEEVNTALTLQYLAAVNHREPDETFLTDTLTTIATHPHSSPTLLTTIAYSSLSDWTPKIHAVAHNNFPRDTLRNIHYEITGLENRPLPEQPTFFPSPAFLSFYKPLEMFVQHPQVWKVLTDKDMSTLALLWIELDHGRASRVLSGCNSIHMHETLYRVMTDRSTRHIARVGHVMEYFAKNPWLTESIKRRLETSEFSTKFLFGLTGLTANPNLSDAQAVRLYRLGNPMVCMALRNNHPTKVKHLR